MCIAEQGGKRICDTGGKRICGCFGPKRDCYHSGKQQPGSSQRYSHLSGRRERN